MYKYSVLAFALQCYTGQLGFPGIPPVELKTCPKAATECANTESEAFMNIGAFKMNFTMKLGQCASDKLCGQFTCNMVMQNQPKPIKITSCQVITIEIRTFFIFLHLIKIISGPE